MPLTIALPSPERLEHLHVYCACGQWVNCCMCAGAVNADGVVFRAFLPEGHPDSCEACREARAQTQLAVALQGEALQQYVDEKIAWLQERVRMYQLQEGLDGTGH